MADRELPDVVRSSTCGRCGEEVRYGTRGNVTGWLHRTEVDHAVIHGQPPTPETLAEVQRQYTEVVRYYDDGKPYTAAEHDILKDPDVDRRRARMAALKGEPLQVAHILEPIEVPCHPIEPDEFAPRSGIRQVINLLPKHDWERVSLTHARGPYVGASGASLGVSDSVVLKGRGPARLDGSVPIAVASWRDGKYDFGYIGLVVNGHCSPTKVDATVLKNWIKGTHELE